MTALHISTAFDSGAIGVLSLADANNIQLRIHADCAAADIAQWFHFSLHGAAGLPDFQDAVNYGFACQKRCKSPSCTNWVALQFGGLALTIEMPFLG